jgi:hypothetical protein
METRKGDHHHHKEEEELAESGNAIDDISLLGTVGGNESESYFSKHPLCTINMRN